MREWGRLAEEEPAGGSRSGFPGRLARPDPRCCDSSLTHTTAVAPVVVRPSKEAMSRDRRRRRRRVIESLFYGSYISAVAIGCISFIYWGCLCPGPEMPLPSESGPQECSGALSFSREWGSIYCIVLGVLLALHLYVTVPAAFWVGHTYSISFAAQTGLVAFAAGLCLVLIFQLGVTERVARLELLPGAVRGIPTGASYVSGLLAWLLVAASAFAGYRNNRRLGNVLLLSSSYSVLALGIGALIIFHVNLFLGIIFGVDLLFVLLWAAHVFVVTGSKWIGLQAYMAPLIAIDDLPCMPVLITARSPARYMAPLIIGTLLGVPLELFRLMPTNGGLAIGSLTIFFSVVALAIAFDYRGIGGFRLFTQVLLFQDLVAVTVAVLSFRVNWVGGILGMLALELGIVAAYDVSMREGNQFGMWMLLPLFEIIISAILLAFALGASTATVLIGPFSSGLATILVAWFCFRRWGVLGGLRALFTSVLCYIQVLYLLIEITVLKMDVSGSAGFCAASLICMLIAVAVGLKKDEGSGRLYGSGIEIICFVGVAQSFGYLSAIIAHVALRATTGSHVAATAIFLIWLITPPLCMVAAGAHDKRANFRRGMVVAVWLICVWWASVALQASVNMVPLLVSFLLATPYSVLYVLFAGFAIRKYLLMLLGSYVIFLISSLVAIYLIYMGPRLDFKVVGAVVGATACGLYGPLLLVRPLARQWGNVREELRVQEHAFVISNSVAVRAAAKAAKPTELRKKHMVKLRRLMKGPLPRLVDLSHNGIMERAGVVRLCFGASDGRPMLPFEAYTLVARGSFLYLFPAEGELLPSTYALSAICVFGAKAIALPAYHDERLPMQRFLVAVRLSMVWKEHHMFFLQLRNAPQMRAWCEDLQRRAVEDSSESALRRFKVQQAMQPDPSLAEGMLLVRKDMSRAMTEAERVAAAKGIGMATPEELAEVQRMKRRASAFRLGDDVDTLEEEMRVMLARSSDAFAIAQTERELGDGGDGAGSGDGADGADGALAPATAPATAPAPAAVGDDSSSGQLLPRSRARYRRRPEPVAGEHGDGIADDMEKAIPEKDLPLFKRPSYASWQAPPIPAMLGERSCHTIKTRNSLAAEKKKRRAEMAATCNAPHQELMGIKQKAATSHQELMATTVFNSVVVYTPRGISGTGDDVRIQYPANALNAM